MPKQTIVLEIDTTNINEQNIESIKNQLAQKLFDEAFRDPGTNAFHIKAEHSRHVKGGISVDFAGVNPQLTFTPQIFDATNLQDLQNCRRVSQILNLISKKVD